VWGAIHSRSEGSRQFQLNWAYILWAFAEDADLKPTVVEEVPLNWSRWIRQLHRWLSIAFTLVVIFNGVAVFKHRYTNWMGLLAVAVLALMFFTGMYLFVLPYITKWWGGRRAD
jgi:hypothetical protein